MAQLPPPGPSCDSPTHSGQGDVRAGPHCPSCPHTYRDGVTAQFKGTLSSQTCKSHFGTTVQSSREGILEAGGSPWAVAVWAAVWPPCSPQGPQPSHWFLLTEHPDICHAAATSPALPLNPLVCLLTNNGNRAAQSWRQFLQSATSSTHTDCPTLVYVAREKRKIKRIPKFPRTSHQTRQRAIAGPNPAFITSTALPAAAPHTPQQGPFILHKLASTRLKCVAQNTHNKRSQLPRRTRSLCSQRKVWRIRAHTAARDFTPFQIVLCRIHHCPSKKLKHHTLR